MNRYVSFIIRLFKTYVLRDRFLLSAKQWFKDDGDKTHQLTYDYYFVWENWKLVK